MTRLAALVLLAAAACGGDRASPMRATVVAWDPSAARYDFADVTLTTLTSLRHLRGTAGEVRAGGLVRLSGAAVTAQGATVESLRSSSVVLQPAGVELATAEAGGVVRAEDFESLQLLSAYATFEAAQATFSTFGRAPPASRRLVAHAVVVDEQGLSPVGPAELYFAPLGTFYLPPAQAIRAQQMPLAFNPGAVAHALAHEAVQELWWGGAPVNAAEASLAPGAVTARHVARSLDEGLADFLSVAASGDPVWFAHTFSQAAGARGLDQLPRCSTPAMRDALSVPDDQAPYDPHPLGTVLAGALLEASSGSSPAQVSRGVVATLPELGRRTVLSIGLLSLPDALDALVAGADAAIRPELCGLFQNRFARLGLPPLPACATVTPATHSECQ